MAQNFRHSKNAILLSEELKKLKNSSNADGEPNFIKKDQAQEATQNQIENFEEVKASEETKEVIEKLKNIIFPKNNQQRNLDREVGGIEDEEKKEISIEDVWDDRSEEVDKMGSINTFSSTGIKSLIWRKKKEKLDLIKEGIEAAAFNSKKFKGKNPKSSEAEAPAPEGYVARLKHLRHDRDHENKNNGQGI